MSMWDFMKCFRNSSKMTGCKEIKMSDLWDRVPPDQGKYLRKFAKQHEEYRQRVRKYPDKLPTIDWQYYKTNVRKEMVSWVSDFEKKYDNLDSMFNNRDSMIDVSKYFVEVNQQTENVKKEIHKFKEESEQRIKNLRKQMEDIKALKPYTEMTMEEFCLARPNEAPDFINKPTFWPHTAEENAPDVAHVHEEDRLPAEKPSKKDNPDPSQPPPKDSPSGMAPKDGKPEATDKGKEIAAKMDKKKDEEVAAKEVEKKVDIGKVSVAKVEEKESTDSKLTDTVTDMASKGIELVKDLGSKGIVLIQSLWEKLNSKRKQQTEASVKAVAVKEGDERFRQRDGPTNICNKTIIRGEDTAKADVKEHHVDLTIESEKKEPKLCQEDVKEVPCKSGESDEKTPLKCIKDVEENRFKKYKEQNKCKSDEYDPRECEKEIKYQDNCESKKREEDDCLNKYQNNKENKSCKETVKEDCGKPEAMPCKDEKPNKDDKKCKPNEKSSLVDAKPEEAKAPSQPTSILPTSTVTSPTGADDNTIIGMHQECLTSENEIFMGLKSGQVLAKDTTAEEDNSDTPITCKRKDKFGSYSDRNEVGKQEQSAVEEIAQAIFEMAQNAANLLSEAKHSVDKVNTRGFGEDAMAHAYKKADRKVQAALKHAHNALDSAKKLLSEHGHSALEAGEEKLFATIERHLVLAKLLANKAASMQKEIRRQLAGIKKREK